MKTVFASRTGNVESIIEKLGLTDSALRIEDGSENIAEDFILLTYTDGYGDVPVEVDDFLSVHSDHLKGVIVSGDQSYGEAYCGAGTVISEQYDVPVLYNVENDGTDEDIQAIKKILNL
jgi:protein involved in ribonucleotide reduction